MVINYHNMYYSHNRESSALIFSIWYVTGFFRIDFRHEIIN